MVNMGQVEFKFSKKSFLWFAFTLLFIAVDVMAANDASMKLSNRIQIKKKSYFSDGKSGKASEAYNAAKYKLLEKQRDNLIFDIKRFLREASDEEQRKELNFRLGSLYMEEYHAKLQKAQAVFQQKYTAWELAVKRNPKSKQKSPMVDNTEAMVSLDKAQRIYFDLAARFPKHHRSDEIFYMLAASSLDQSKTKQAMTYFEKLIAYHPKSKFAINAYLELGDYHFNTHNFKLSESYYDRLIRLKDPSLMTYARYKKAWCAYNLDRKEESLKLFKWVISHEDKESEGGESLVKIKGEALRDIILPFAHLGKHQEAIQFFRPFGKDKLRQAMESMASLYFEAGKYSQTRYLKEKLLVLDRNHPSNPSYELDIVQSYEKEGQHEKSIDRLFSKIPSYLKNSRWYEVNAAKPAVVREAKENFEEVARKYALKYHSDAQKTKKDSLYRFALGLYGKYLKYFPTTNEAPQIRFYMAEILFKDKHYELAAGHYYEVFQDRRAGKLRKDSIEFALTSLGKAINIERQKKGLGTISATASTKHKHSKKDKLLPYSPTEKKLIEVGTVYLKTYPKEKTAPDVLYERSYLQYSHFDLLVSYKGFWSFIRSYPQHSSSLNAANFVLDILNQKNNYPLLKSACQNFLRNPAFAKQGAFLASTASILRHTELKLISEMEQKKAYSKAARAYLEYIKGYGIQDEALYEKALYNASVNFEKAGEFLSSVQTQEKFLRRFPQSGLKQNMTLSVAKNYEKLADFEKAALYYESFAASYPTHPQAMNTARMAGLYHWGAGKYDRAEAMMKNSIARSRGTSLQKLIKQDLVDFYQSQNKQDDLIAFYDQERRQVSASDWVEYSVKMAELKHQRNHGNTLGFIQSVLSQAARSQSQLGKSFEGREALSKLLFWSAQNKENNFYQIQLTLPERTLENRLNAKLGLIKQIERDYEQVSRLGAGDWGLGGMYKTAMAYHHLALSVQQSPIPSNLSGPDVEVYRRELKKNLITPFMQKAERLAVQCVDKAQELNLLSAWSPRCYALAGKLRPKRYPVVRTFYLPAEQTALIMPKKGELNIPVGDINSYPLPLLSSRLFQRSSLRNLASLSPFGPQKTSGIKSNLFDGADAVPELTNYQVLAQRRSSTLNDATQSKKPRSRTQKNSFAYLNLMRATQPQQAKKLIIEAIELNPGSFSLFNLLALAHLEAGEIGPAKVIWLSMMAQGDESPEILNNLGVASHMLGLEEQARGYFESAMKKGERFVAATNLGFIALKYHNGFEAKRYFQRALGKNKQDETLHIAHVVAQLQNLEFKEAKRRLPMLLSRFKGNPYASLSAAYFLMDFENKHERASQVLTKYMGKSQAGQDLQFRKALQEAKQGSMASRMPSID